MQKFLWNFYIFVLNLDFIIYIDFIRIATSNTSSVPSQIRSHIAYLIHTNNIVVLFL